MLRAKCRKRYPPLGSWKVRASTANSHPYSFGREKKVSQQGRNFRFCTSLLAQIIFWKPTPGISYVACGRPTAGVRAPFGNLSGRNTKPWIPFMKWQLATSWCFPEQLGSSQDGVDRLSSLFHIEACCGVDRPLLRVIQEGSEGSKRF